MLFTPFNFSFSLQRVAVFEWEPVQPAEDAAAARPPAACEDAASQPHEQPLDTTPPAMQLVFKGYEWASVANCGLFPRPSFEDCFVGGPEHASDQADSTESERRARQHEGVRRTRPAGAAPDQPNGADGSISTPAQFDPLKSRQR
jgi:hypothetical protein